MHIYPQRTSLHELGGEIFKLVSYGATPEQWAEWLRVPLEHAAARGNLGLVNTLLEAGANGSAGWRGCRGRTLLHAAAVGGNPDVLTALLRAGAQPDAHVTCMYPPRSAVHVAAVCGHDEVARRLLQEPGVDKCSLLGDAAFYGHEQLAGDLLTAGADPNSVAEDNGETPLHEAASRGHVGIVSALLLAGAHKNALDNRGASPLCAAAAGGEVATIEILLAAGVDVHIRDSTYGLSAVDLAIVQGHFPALKALLRHGVDVNYRLKSEAMTALHIAVKFNRVDAIDALMEVGADIEIRTTDGLTPLNEAAGNPSVCCETMLGLLERGASVRARDKSGLTPLHLVCFRDSPGAFIDLLLRWGADETAVGNRGQPPANILAGNDRKCSRAEVERVHLLLARAPADRAWRRRSWLVLLRSRASKASGESHDAGASSGDAAGRNVVDGDGEPKCPSATGSDGSDGSHSVEHGGGAQPSGDGVGVGGGGGGAGVGADGGDLSSLVALLVGFEVEGVFRTVVGFL